jgi:hypothetical protein
MNWGTIRDFSLRFGIWIKDAGWPWGTPNIGNDEIQSSFKARESSS